MGVFFFLFFFWATKINTNTYVSLYVRIVYGYEFVKKKKKKYAMSGKCIKMKLCERNKMYAVKLQTNVLRIPKMEMVIFYMFSPRDSLSLSAPPPLWWFIVCTSFHIIHHHPPYDNEDFEKLCRWSAIC